MLLVRQPIPRWIAMSLGILSVSLLIGAYAWLANQRYQAKVTGVREKLDTVQAELAVIQQQLTSAAAGQGDVANAAAALEAKQERLRQQQESLTKELTSTSDRTVPTLTSLYEDGLLRVLKPQGLKKDEYWLLEDLAATGYRLVAGLLVGLICSMTIGILMGAYTPVEAFFVPPLSFLAKIPPTAMLAVFFVVVGTTLKMYVTIIAFGMLPTLAQTVYQSVRKDIPESLIFKAYTLGASHAELIWNVIFKQTLPRLIDAARLQIGPAMVLLIAAEWMVAGEGFGYRLRIFYQRTDMTVVYVYLVILGLGGLLADYALIWLRRTICPWFGE